MFHFVSVHSSIDLLVVILDLFYFGSPNNLSPFWKKYTKLIAIKYPLTCFDTSGFKYGGEPVCDMYQSKRNVQQSL